MSSAVIANGSLGLMAGSLLLFASALSVYRLNAAENTTLDPAALNWLGQIHLKLDSGSAAYGPFLSEAVLPEKDFVGPLSATPISMIAAQERLKTSHPISGSRLIARVKSAFKKNNKSHEVIHAARTQGPRKIRIPQNEAPIITAQSAPIAPVVLVAAPSVQESTQSTQATVTASSDELNSLQGMRQLIRGHFLLSMTTQPAMAETLIAQLGPKEKTVDPVEMAAVEAIEPESSTGFHPLHRRKHHAPAHMTPRVAPEPEQIPAPAVPVGDTKKPEQDEILITQASPALSADAEALTTPVNRVGTNSEQTKLPTLEGDARGTSAELDYSDANQKASPPTSPVISQSSGLVMATAGSIVHVNHQNTNPAGTAQSTVPAAPQSKSPPPEVSRQSPPDLRVNEASTAIAANDYSKVETLSDYPSVGLTTNHIPAAMSEAFDWVSKISGGDAYVFSKESGAGAQGWVYAQATDHWPTLARRNSQSIPLISKNTGKLLATLAGTALQSEAGIIFGKLAPGWSVRLSGRSERAIFLNAQNQTVVASNLEGERYFAFLNTAPGSHLLYLTNRAGSEEGALGLAAQAGVATYADLSTVKRASFYGRVFDGSEGRPEPLSGVSVRVLGSVSARAETDFHGKFKIENIITVGDHPVFVETDASSGYTHRYQLYPTQLQSVSLFRLNETAIQTWIRQLEGTISPESGMVIAALPNLVSSLPASVKLTPVVRSLSASPTLRPEVYTLSANGQMQVDRPLDSQSIRFFSVQVPEGPAIARLTDDQKNLVWSEMIMVSPAVVNIVGPY